MPEAEESSFALLPQDPEPFDHRDALVLAGASVLYLPFTLLGFGSDVDTYLVLECGRRLVEEGVYVPSRNPGYLLFEVATLGLEGLGGSLACNLASVVASLVAIHFFLRLLSACGVAHRQAWAACLVVHPSWWQVSTSTAEPAWSVAALLGGSLALAQRRWAAAAVLLGLAVALRHQAAFSVAPLLLFALVAARGMRRRIVLTGAGALALALPFFLPPLHSAGWSLTVLSGHMDESERAWTPLLWFGRFAYKSAWFWGLPALLVIAVAIVVSRRQLLRLWSERRLLVSFLLLTIGAHALLFLRYPFKRSYLLYTLPVALLLLAMAQGGRVATAWTLAAALGLQGLVSIELARPDVPRHATGARFGLFIQAGDLVRDVRLRRRLMPCRDSRCWLAVVEAREPGAD